MGLRLWLIGFLAITAFAGQVSGYYVKQEAAELRALVRQVAADSERLEKLRTDEMFRRRPAQLEEWAHAFGDLGPPQLSQVHPNVRHALLPVPIPRPADPQMVSVPLAPPKPAPSKPLPSNPAPLNPAPGHQDVISTLIQQAELSL